MLVDSTSSVGGADTFSHWRRLRGNIVGDVVLSSSTAMRSPFPAGEGELGLTNLNTFALAKISLRSNITFTQEKISLLAVQGISLQGGLFALLCQREGKEKRAILVFVLTNGEEGGKIKYTKGEARSLQ